MPAATVFSPITVLVWREGGKGDSAIGAFSSFIMYVAQRGRDVPIPIQDGGQAVVYRSIPIILKLYLLMGSFPVHT